MGILVLNAAELAIRTGAWDAGVRMLEDTLALEPDLADRLVLLAQLSMIAVLRGSTDDPHLREFEAASADVPPALERLINADLEIVGAQLRGDYETALRTATEGAAGDELNAPALYERAARAALWLGDARRLSEVAALFRGIGRAAPTPAAQLAAVEAAEAALLGRRDEAAEQYRDVMRRYEALGLHFDHALVALDAARALGPGNVVGAAAIEDARATFVRLGALAVLAFADSLAGGGAMRAEQSSGVAVVPAERAPTS
jgi:hypothetical protein